MFSQVPKLRSERILLRGIEDEDAAALVELYSNEKIYRYRPGMVRKTVPMVKKLIARYRQEFSAGTAVYWAVCPIEDAARVIGVGEVFNIENKTDSVEIGYSVCEECWGRGIGEETVRVLVSYLFEQVQVNRIQARVMPGNIPSERVLLKNHFTREGLIRQGVFWNGKGIVDVNQFARIKEDYG